MTSSSRLRSESGIYHVMMRGNGRQIIFEDDADRLRFLDSLVRFKKDSCVELHAYCLMDNHVHLLIYEAVGSLESFMRRLCTGYAMYFNMRHERVGSLFQGRYLTEPVKDDAQYMVTLRYILQNPQKAGIAATEEYKWSSFHAYTGGERTDVSGEGSGEIVDVEFAIKLFGTVKELERFVLEDAHDECLDVADSTSRSSTRRRHTTEELLTAFVAEGVDNALLKTMPKEARNQVLRRLLSSGFSIREIERVTGISRGIIQRVTRR